MRSSRTALAAYSRERSAPAAAGMRTRARRAKRASALGNGAPQQVQPRAAARAEIHTALDAPLGIAIDARLESPAGRSCCRRGSAESRCAPISCEHRIDLRDVLVAPRIARIDDVQQQGGLARLGQRRLERRHQLVRQLADEADGVGGHHRRAARAA